MRIRPYEAKDASAIAAIFFDSVRQGALRDYSPAQVAAWAPTMPDMSQVQARAGDGRLVLVAVHSADEPAAYIELEANGHIDHLYCRPDLIGEGLASALYDRVEQEARRRGLTRLYVEASEAARRLFLKKGFVELERRGFQLKGVRLHNYRMEKGLGG